MKFKYNSVICGSSDTVLQQMIEQGIRFDLILTDPPYNINKDFGNNSDKTGYCMHKFDKNWAKCYNIKIII